MTVAPDAALTPFASTDTLASTPAPDTGGGDVPVMAFLKDCHARFKDDDSGAVADYIPELLRADPAHFGIALATIDGHVHEFGDTRVPFTIQSVSKAFVYGLAIEFAGADLVAETIGVEPSGEAFNSIRLDPENRPFNPMVNAGAIACTGLIHHLDPDGAFERIRAMLSQCAGRELDVDDAVFTSERATGDRNRAIAWLLRNNGVLRGDVDASLDTYFRQCAILVSARDLAVMGATLANNGINPVTGVTVFQPSTVARVLSVMVSAGMYDFSGRWIYRVGLPAKSGVGGGITAALPAQLGLGTFSPRLDAQGNSVRGIRVYERLSTHFGLHVLNRQGDVSASIAADYDLSQVTSPRDRNATERNILDCYGQEVRVLELGSTMNLVSCDYISRVLAAGRVCEYVLFDLRRVMGMSTAAARVLSDLFAGLERTGTHVVLSSYRPDAWPHTVLRDELKAAGTVETRSFATLKDAAEWAEDQIIFLRGGFTSLNMEILLAEQALLEGLAPKDLKVVAAKMEPMTFRVGDKLITAGDVGDCVYFLERGMASVVLESGVPVATAEAGTCVGEMALLSPRAARSADVIADTAIKCHRLSLSAYDQLRTSHPALAEIMLRNLANLLAARLRQANVKIEILSRA